MTVVDFKPPNPFSLADNMKESGNATQRASDPSSAASKLFRRRAILTKGQAIEIYMFKIANETAANSAKVGAEAIGKKYGVTSKVCPCADFVTSHTFFTDSLISS